MRTRKRSIHAVQGPAPTSSSAIRPSEVKRARLSDLRCSQLQGRGFTGLKLLPDTNLALEIAAVALHVQLEDCSKQSKQERFAGFKSFPHKERLEHHAGSSVLNDLPILQHVAAEVSLGVAHHAAFALRLFCHSSSVSNNQHVSRQFRPCMTSQQA